MSPEEAHARQHDWDRQAQRRLTHACLQAMAVVLVLGGVCLWSGRLSFLLAGAAGAAALLGREWWRWRPQRQAEPTWIDEALERWLALQPDPTQAARAAAGREDLHARVRGVLRRQARRPHDSGVA